MPFEDQLGDAMRSTGDGFVPEDRRALLDGALMSGRRRLARRRAATVTGSVVALAAVGLGGAWASGLVGGSSGGSGAPAARPRPWRRHPSRPSRKGCRSPPSR